MKHIKKFGNEYEIGDYVKLDYPGKIYQAGKIELIDPETDFQNAAYKITSFTLDTSELRTFWTSNHSVIRLLTLKEIEKFKTKLDAIKYNL
jgi:hypothetical protein